MIEKTKIRRINNFTKYKVIFGVATDKLAVHFHVDPGSLEDDFPFCGLEFHKYSETGSYCNYLGKCQPNGSALMGEDLILPVYKRCNETYDFDPLWDLLVYWLNVEADRAKEEAE